MTTALTLPRKTVQQLMAFAQQKPQDSQTAYISAELGFSRQPLANAWAMAITHPDQNTEPTAKDLEQAQDHALLLILSLNTKGVLEVQAWQQQASQQNQQRVAVDLKI